MFYFSPFPVVTYDPLGENTPQLACDITRRFKITEVLNNRQLVYYGYTIKDRDRPDIMAEKYYDNPRLDWLFFIVNQKFDPYFQWPLNQFQFDSYIRQKYGSPSVAQGTVHHYEQILNTRKEHYSNYDSSTIVIPEKKIIIDKTTYVSLASSLKRTVSVFDYEEELNNKKREIKILDRVFLPSLMKDFKRIFA